MFLIHDRCHLCGELKGLMNTSWSFSNGQGRKKQMSLTICMDCRYKATTLKEEEKREIVDMTHLDNLITDLEREANRYDTQCK